MMRQRLPSLSIILVCGIMCGCSKPVSQRMKGTWSFDDAASTANWDIQGTPPAARKKITSLIGSATIGIDKGKITAVAGQGKTTIGYEILQDGDRLLVARIESRNGRKRADIKVEMRSGDVLTLSSDYPVPGATAVLTRNQDSEK